MRELTVNEIQSISGAGNDSYDPTSLIVGIGTTLMKLPTPVGVGVTVGTEVLLQAKQHLPVSTPVPVMIGPTWNGSGNNTRIPETVGPTWNGSGNRQIP
ncbi:hypothetical protein [Candidatus Symbiopectobacterium sp. NZEC135]|uniref:hypothetical protein n=1 Tax=Candidatus Symbiopectobacterium sp. NZEC135 TaxID=2820471 RepID=UPI00189B3D01|nr:hypothetical protein [Candidatus Symbiopectobacterium sp. NZEC135]MCW2479727.1 hypothetical protein [Candidatus Symbiopectobacterium sp. NZEC135]